MILRKILIEAEVPREIGPFNGSFEEGLLFTRIFGFLFFITGLILCLICLFKHKNYLLGILFLGLCIYGAYLINYTDKLPKERRQIYINGSIVKAEVIKHGSRFHPLKLTTEYILWMRDSSNNDEIKVSHTIKGMHHSAPIGSETLGIFYKGNYFFGESIGGRFRTRKN